MWLTKHSSFLESEGWAGRNLRNPLIQQWALDPAGLCSVLVLPVDTSCIALCLSFLSCPLRVVIAASYCSCEIIMSQLAKYLSSVQRVVNTHAISYMKKQIDHILSFLSQCLLLRLGSCFFRISKKKHKNNTYTHICTNLHVLIYVCYIFKTNWRKKFGSSH